MSQERATFSHSIEKDPFNGTTSLYLWIDKCPALSLSTDHVFEAEYHPYDVSTRLQIYPGLFIFKDGHSNGVLVFSSPCFRTDCEISILFDDGSILSRVLTSAGHTFYWEITKEDSEAFMNKKINIIRAQSSGNIFDYKLLEQRDWYQGLPEIFQDLCVEFIRVADKELHWSPPSEKKLNPVPDYSDGSEFTADDSDACYVYLMHDASNGCYKIGMSNNPEYRESTLQSEKPTIEKVCEKKYPSRRIASAIEASLHKVFQEKRIRGEWFVLDARDIWELKQTLS